MHPSSNMRRKLGTAYLKWTADMAGIKKLLFVDTNIWLDLYKPRASDAAALELLTKLESIKDKIIVTFILEMEYKKNRQNVMAKSLKDMAHPQSPAPLGIFSEARATQTIDKSQKAIKKRLDMLKKRLEKALADPIHHDPVYKACQRIFRRDHDLVLGFDADKRLKAKIRAKAIRRFYLGCPPRKANDTSIGDAINWEWMLHCAERNKAELVILTRDSDFGITIGKNVYLNDHLKQEFQDRVSKKRKILLYSSAVEALKHFAVSVSKETEASEGDFAGMEPVPLGDMFAGLSASSLEKLLLSKWKEAHDTSPPGQVTNLTLSVK
jgi:hypothetical protein